VQTANLSYFRVVRPKGAGRAVRIAVDMVREEYDEVTALDRVTPEQVRMLLALGSPRSGSASANTASLRGLPRVGPAWLSRVQTKLSRAKAGEAVVLGGPLRVGGCARHAARKQ